MGKKGFSPFMAKFPQMTKYFISQKVYGNYSCLWPLIAIKATIVTCGVACSKRVK